MSIAWFLVAHCHRCGVAIYGTYATNAERYSCGPCWTEYLRSLS